MAKNGKALFAMGVEFGYKCHEKGMNLEMALAEAARILGPTNHDHCICVIGSVFVHPHCKAKEHRK